MATIEEIPSDEEITMTKGAEKTTDQVEIAEGSSDDDDVPELEKGDAPAGMGQKIEKPQGRQERKARQSIKKLGLTPVTGVTRVAIRKTKSMLFVINKPDVFKNPSSDTYVVFGEAKVEDPTGQSQFNAARQVDQMRAAQEAAQAASMPTKPTDLIEEEVSDGEEDDGANLEEKDIELVIQQANCSRAKAIKALRENDGDIVNSIMAITV